MGARIRAFDWSKTAIGPIENWSPSLKMMVRFLLANRFPMLLWWGPDFVQIYNDPYRPILGAKHPTPGLGHPVRECWSEIWHILRPLIETPFNGGPSTWMEDILLEINRHGYMEESHFTIAYSPVPDETVASGIGGVLATVHEITAKVVGERRVVALRDVSARLSEAKSAEQSCNAVAKALAMHDKDVPFVLLYLMDADGKHAHLHGVSGGPLEKEFAPETIDLGDAQKSAWPVVEALQTGSLQVIKDLQRHFPKVPTGPWADAPNTAVVVPIPSNTPEKPAGVMIAGVSARLKFDAFYRDFFELMRTQVASAIASTRAYDEERKRAEALAEIDRAKTAFFSNVSHEFRTPLTLLLGPAEDMLANKHGALPREAAEQVDVIHRNALRLQRLVNTMLDFSRIEAGRVRASYVETDLTALTADLANVFRATMERAGLNYEVHLQPLPAPVFVDQDMWEKIVFNLLSNAFKFTLSGSVKISLAADDGEAVLTVSDSGIGIPSEELPNVFKRFHRIEGRNGRTHEGTGIGLALVQELAKLHGGNISVRSVVGKGTTFEVRVPFGKGHLPADRINAAPKREHVTPSGAAFVEEALTWLPEELPAAQIESTDGEQKEKLSERPRVILAEDNADMRFYIHRLLQADYSVEAVADGAAALEAARRNPPDLILSDVMMPHMNGFEVVQAVRSDDRLQATPVILLSARAGEEARLESASQPADDYLVKPFSARELLARVGVHIRLARARVQHEADHHKNEMRLNMALEGGQMGLWEWDLPSNLSRWNAKEYQILGLPVGRGTEKSEKFLQLIHPDDAPGLQESLSKVVKHGTDWHGEFRIRRPDGKVRWLAGAGRVYRDRDGQAVTMIGVNYDITERKHAEDTARRNRERLELLTEASQVGVWLCDLPFNELTWDYRVKEHFWLPPNARVTIQDFYERIHPDDREVTRRAIEKSVEEKSRYNLDYRTVSPNGRIKWIRAIGHAHYDAYDNPIRFDGVTIDITESKLAEARNRFLVSLDDALRPLAEPGEITIKAAQVLGEYLGVDRCAYADVEADVDTMNLTGNYLRSPEIRSIVGRLKFSDFGPEVLQLMRENKAYVVNDVDTHKPSIPDPAAYRATQIQAVICVPLHKAGKLVAAMAVHTKTPRHWTNDEVELVSAVAARCWESIERAKLQRGLSESQLQYRSLFESIDEGFCVIEMLFDSRQKPVDYRFVEVNPAFEKQAGMRDATGKRMLEFVSSIELHWLENYGRVAKTGEPIRFADEYQSLNRWFDVYAFRVGNPGENKVAVIFNNITSEKMAQLALSESEERFRAFVTTSTDVVYRMNADWTEMRQLQGKNFIADTENPNRDWIEKYIHPEDRQHVLATIEKSIRTKSPFKLEHRVIRVDGSIGWTASRAIPLLDAKGQIREWFGAASDVTERHRAEEALRDETRILELLKDTGSAISAQLDLQALVQIVTDAGTKICGAEFGAFFYNVINSSGESYLLYSLSGAPREAFDKFGMPRNTPVFNETFSGNGVVRSDDITKDPRYGRMAPHHGMPKGHLPVRSYLAVPVISRSGEVIGGLFFGHSETNMFTKRSERILVGVAAQAAIAIDNARLYEAAQREIAERKRVADELQKAKEELSHHAEDLEQQVSTRTASLREALSQLEEFSYSVSHDLRAPLRAIVGYSRVFREDYGEGLPPDAHTFLDKISRSAQRMERLVNEVLTLSRVSRADLQLRPIQLQQFIDDLVEQNPLLQPPAADVAVATPHAVMADEARLGQAISNLLSNAVKFVPSGEKPVVRVRSEVVKDCVRVWVEDQGIGIPAQLRGKLFGMFQRLNASQPYEGTGIGLAIVRKAVEVMGGSVGMESNEPKGSRFWIELRKDQS